MKKIPFVIGILGGMGTYATIHLFKQYAEIFSAKKEWDRPRIIIDNNCTMPSRVRAFLYDENEDLLVKQMADSLRFLIQAGATKIILDCNTSHLFLEKIYEILPEARNYIFDIIDNLTHYLTLCGVRRTYLLASEGTITSGIYQKKLISKNIKCIVPNVEEFLILRKFIESVKQNESSQQIQEEFVKFVTNISLFQTTNVCVGGG